MVRSYRRKLGASKPKASPSSPECIDLTEGEPVTAKKTTKTMTMNKGPSPDTVMIDLTEDDGDDSMLLESRLGDVRTSLNDKIESQEEDSKKPTAVTQTSNPSKRAKVKHERKSDSTTSASTTEDTDICIVDAPAMVPVAQMPQAVSNTTEGDDVVVVGARNQVLLPHMRQHCTNRPFDDASTANRFGLYKIDQIEHNSQFCDNCYCYVCDCPAKECQRWKSVEIATASTNHCCATDKLQNWKRMRQLEKNSSQPHRLGVLPPADSEDDDDDNDEDDDENDTDGYDSDDFPYGGFGGYNRFISSHTHIPVRQPPGPFAPGDKKAKKNPDLTKCRMCGWYNRFSHRNFRASTTDERSCAAWCHQCGRIASERDFGRTQSVRYLPTSADVKLGEKIIPFRIHSHDPRLFQEYKKNWENNADATNDEWLFDEASMEHDFFRHRINKYPVVRSILESIPAVDEENIPKTGAVKVLGTSSALKNISADETDYIIIEDRNHRNLFQVLHKFGTVGVPAPENGRKASSSPLMGDIEATYDRNSRTGSLKVRLWLGPQAFSKSYTSCRFSDLLGLWFDIFPLPLADIGRALKAETSPILASSSWQGHTSVSVPPFRITNGAPEIVTAQQEQEKEVQSYNNSNRDLRSKLPLCSSSGSDNLGGVTDASTSMADVFKRFFTETIIDELDSPSPGKRWLELGLGCVSFHRRTASASDRSKPSILLENSLDWILDAKDAVLATNLNEACYALRRKLGTMNGFMEHLENIGHAGVDIVEGLNVELLEFQRQSVQWALERETAPGGIQSYWWLKVPVPDCDAIFYNPIFDRFTRNKPRLVRGGFIAEEMGLGKTVISLALILQNPAPELPPSGSDIGLLNNEPEKAGPNDRLGWDKDLYMQTSTSNTKRGSILSHGTLVICPVSLVGQWIEEGRSKLKDPGLLYPYHGSNRNRNACVLAKNAIVVTTYQVLASDATYHAKKQGEGYCAPLEQVRWWRIIYDEGHSLREGQTVKYKAIANLVSDHKWLVSGTPVSTSLQDLKTQMKILGIDDVDEIFRQAAGLSSGKRGRHYVAPSDGMGKLMFLLRSIMMRHTQKQKYRGTSTTLMSLPKKTERNIEISFSAEELIEYQKLEQKALEFYVDFKSMHGSKLSSHFLKISQKLTPMRVACSGGRYPMEDTENVDDDSDDQESAGKKKEVKYSKFVFESKFKKLLSELEQIRDNDPTSKSLVFSQYTSTLTWLQGELPKHGFQFRTLSGDMTMKNRAKALHDFQSDPPTTIFLLSMRAGAVGINLTQANRVFIMEPCMNPALERQAIGRVHRLGQKRSVEIVRLVVKDTVESRLSKLLNSKYGDDSTEVAVDSPVGCVATDRTTILTGEFDLLFGAPDPIEEGDDSSEGGGVRPDELKSWGCI